MLLVPLAVLLTREGGSPGPGVGERVTSPASSDRPRPSPSTDSTDSTDSIEDAGKVRVVTSGERVEVSPGTEIWLTKEGKHWSEPDLPDQFRSVVDGNLDLSSPGVTLQGSGQANGVSFLSGIFYGEGEPARVTIETVAGDVNGTALTLAGKPGWGVWYVEVKVPDSVQSSMDALSGVARRVTVYDSAGEVIASQEFS